MTGALRRIALRITLASASFLLADVIIACTVFSLAILVIFAGFGFAWIGLAKEYATYAMTFGTADQLRAAGGLLLVCPALGVVVGYLGILSFELPRKLWRLARDPGRVPSPGAPPPAPVRRPDVPMAEGALWAVRRRSASVEFHYVSLLIRGA